MIYVYKIIGPGGKGYIGISRRKPIQRFRSHISEMRRGSVTALHCAMRVYGAEKFSISTLAECVDAREARVCERALIAAHNTYAHAGNGYNLTIGGDGNHGWKMSEETRRKIGEKSRQRVLTPEASANMSAARKGRVRGPFSVEHRAKLSAALKGRTITPEWRAKLAIAGTGRKQRDETIIKRLATRMANEDAKRGIR